MNRVDIIPDTFEEGLSELEDIVNNLEEHEADIEKAMMLFERAVFLGRWCNEFLQNIDRRIKILSTSENGVFGLDDFEEDEA